MKTTNPGESPAAIHSVGPFTFPFSTLNNRVISLISAGKPVRSVRVRIPVRFSAAVPTDTRASERQWWQLLRPDPRVAVRPPRKPLACLASSGTGCGPELLANESSCPRQAHPLGKARTTGWDKSLTRKGGYSLQHINIFRNKSIVRLQGHEPTHCAGLMRVPFLQLEMHFILW